MVIVVSLMVMLMMYNAKQCKTKPSTNYLTLHCHFYHHLQELLHHKCVRRSTVPEYIKKLSVIK